MTLSRLLRSVPLPVCLLALHTALPAAGQEAVVRVEASVTEGPIQPIHAWFGYDEPNYTYMRDGSRLLAELSALSPVPVHVRAHYLLTDGDGPPTPKWGYTNVYREDPSGNPVYDWTLMDRVFDTWIQAGLKPLVEIGFMPEALSSRPHPYKHSWPQGSIASGTSYPPKDYGKWAELIYQWVRHAAGRYGEAEVRSWYWEPWNEPDIACWQGTPEEYFKLYDYTADAVKRALPGARIGGPHSTGPASE